MKPTEFSWTEDQQVTVINPTSAAHRFKVHNKEYELGAGRTAKMPGYIAWIYVYEMAAQAAQADKVFNRWNEENFRKQYFDKFVAGVAPLIENVTVEETGLHSFDDAAGDVPADVPSKVSPHGRPAKV